MRAAELGDRHLHVHSRRIGKPLPRGRQVVRHRLQPIGQAAEPIAQWREIPR
jgi:hypothetical protein